MYTENPHLEHDEAGNVHVVKAAVIASNVGDAAKTAVGMPELLKQHEDMKAMHDKHQADSLAHIKSVMGNNN